MVRPLAFETGDPATNPTRRTSALYEQKPKWGFQCYPDPRVQNERSSETFRFSWGNPQAHVVHCTCNIRGRTVQGMGHGLRDFVT